MTLVVDHTERLKAIDPEESFIVSAPAGSGKTGLITQRILCLLGTVNHPEEILSITFTRKAAAEMAARVHSALQTAANEPRPENQYEAQTWDFAQKALQQDQSLNWNLLDMPNRLRIQTIDSFCRYIARQFSLETKLGDLSEPSDQPEVHYQSASRSLLQKLETDDALTPHLTVLLAHTGNDLARCERLLSELLGKREEWLPIIYGIKDNHHYFEQVIDQIVAENIIDLQDRLMPVAGELIELADFAATHVPEGKNPSLTQLAGITELPDVGLSGIADWQTLLRMLVTKDGAIRSKVDKNGGFPSDKKEHKSRMETLLDWCRVQADLVSQINNILHLPSKSINVSEQLILNALAQLLPRLAAELDIEFKAHDQCDYSAITLAALEAVSPTSNEVVSDITLRLDYQLRHILVDEFQDTSGSQVELLAQLVSGWQPDDGRTLFLVGDAMQSLYGFRNANVGLFINSQRHPVGTVQCTPINLTTNFRSEKGIVDWVNNAFTEAFPKKADISRGAIPYSLAAAFKSKSDHTAVHFQGFTGDLAESEEAKHIANTCLQINQDDPAQSIAILVRSRGHLKHIIPALQTARLNWEAHDITPLGTRMPVLDMMSLTRALVSPADRIAWLALLRTPFCGLGLEDLLTISNSTMITPYNGDAILGQLQNLMASSSAAKLTDYGRVALERIIPILLNAWGERRRVDIRTEVESIWQSLGGAETVSGDADLSDLRSYLDLLETWQVAGLVRDWSLFELAVEKLYANPSPHYSADQLKKTKIQIMTIHKSKGLEFDHVILPSLTSKSASDSKPLLRWQKIIGEDNQSALIMAPLGAHDEEDDPVYGYLKYESNLKKRLEDTRVLYVAVTRAISKLYLYGKLIPGKKEGWNTPGKTSLISPIWPSVLEGLNAEVYNVIATPEHESPEDQKKQLRHIRRLPSDFVTRNNHQYALLTVPATKSSDLELTPDSDLSLRARHFGTVLHRSLKQIANDGLRAWPNDRIHRLPAAWTGQLKELGILVSEQELEDLSKAIYTITQEAKGQWILGNHEEAYCEQSLSHSLSGSDKVGVSIIDRTFIDGGFRWIIDYKFAQPNDSESLSQFEQRQIDRYLPQLAHYANLYRQIGSEPVRCALYFPQIGLFSEVTVD